MLVVTLSLFSFRNNTIEIHLCLQQLPGGRGFPGSLRHTPPLFGALFISAVLWQLHRAWPSCCRWTGWHRAPGIWKKMEWSSLIPLSEKEIIYSWYCWQLSNSLSGSLGSPAPPEGMCWLWPPLPATLSSSTATPALLQEPPVLLCWIWELPVGKGGTS